MRQSERMSAILFTVQRTVANQLLSNVANEKLAGGLTATGPFHIATKAWNRPRLRKA